MKNPIGDPLLNVNLLNVSFLKYYVGLPVFQFMLFKIRIAMNSIVPIHVYFYVNMLMIFNVRSQFMPFKVPVLFFFWLPTAVTHMSEGLKSVYIKSL